MIRPMSSSSDGYPSHTESSMGLQVSSLDESMIYRGLDTWHLCINRQDCLTQLICKSRQTPLQSVKESWMQLLPANCYLVWVCPGSKLGDHTSIDCLVVIGESSSWPITMIKKMVRIREWNWPRKFYKKLNTQS